jgi:hypothetical protein
VASYEAIINLVVQGEAALNRIQKKIDNLYKTVGDLETKKKFQGSQAAVSFVRQQAEELERAVSVSKQQVREQERSIIKQSKLNSAVDLYERRQRQLSRTSVANQKQFAAQIKDIEDGFKFFKDRKNAAGVQAIATELGRIIEYDNELNRISDRRTANQRKLYSFSKEIAKYESFGLKTDRARKTLSNFEGVAGSNQLKQAQQYESALKNQLKLLKDQFTEQQRVARIAPSSPIRGGLNFPGSPIAEQRALKEARAGFPSSPILGSVTMAGSPKAEQERLKREKEIAEATGLAGKAAQRLVGAQGRVELTSAIDQYLSGLDNIQSGAQKILKKDASLLKDFDQKLKNRETAKKSEKAIAEATGLAERAAQRLVGIENRTELASAIDEYLTGLSDVQSGAEKLLKKNAKSLKDFDQRLKERGDFQKSQEKAIADAWKMRGGPALPTGFNEAGIIKQKGASVDIGAQRRLQSVLASGAIIEQGLINLRSKGANVSRELVDLQSSLNTAKQKDYTISENTLDVLASQVSLAGKFAQLQRTILAGQAGGGRGGAEVTTSGLEQALQRLQEARGARQAFLGGASPAQAIDQIVREFNKGQPAQNVTGTFADGLLGGSKEMVTAATTAFTAALEAIKKVFRIASPSRVMKEIASNLISSFIAELVSNIPSVKAALEQTFTAKDIDFEQPGRGLPRRAPLATQIDPGYLAALSGAPLTPGRPSPAGIFSAPAARVGAPGSAFPFQTYDMSYPQFPVGTAAQLNPPSSLKNRPGDTSQVLSAAIKEYRAAVDNFWEGEDSQFEAIKKIVVSSSRLAAAQLARRLQQAKDLTPDQQFQQAASEARSLLSAGRQSGISRLAGAAGDLITGERRLGVSKAVGSALQRISDSVLNSVEALGFSVSDSFENGIDRIRSGVPSAISRGLSAISGGFGGGAAGGGGTGGGGAAGGGGSVDQVAQLLGLDAIADISRVSTRELEALSAAASELRAVLDPTIEGFDRLDNQLRETIGQIGRQIERRAPEAGFLTRQFGPRTARGLSEGLIGGAFPLLFGQGIGAAVGGGAGGFAGGFAGGGLGFGLSLVGTALGTAFDTAVQSATELGSALQKPVENFDKLTEKSFFSSKALENTIKKTIEYGDTATASALIQEESIKKLGVNGVQNLKILGTESDRLNRAFAELGQQMQAVAAGPLSAVTGFFANIFGQAAAAGRVRILRSNLNEQQAGQFNQEILGRLQQRGIQRGFFAPSAPTEAEIGMLQQQGALQDIVDKWQAIQIKGQIKIDPKQRIESEINALQKQLEAIDIGRSLKDQVRSTAKEQQDLDKQRFDLVRSYEDSIAGLRRQVEDEIRSKRFATLEKENQLLDAQGQLRIKQLQIENQAAIAKAGVGERPEIEQTAKEVAQIVAQFSEQQLTAEEEAAKIKRDAALEVQKIDSDAAQLKVNIEKEVSRLNIETARKVAEINDQVRRRNEEIDTRRFTIERDIAALKLRLFQDELALATKNAALPLEARQQAFDLYEAVAKERSDVEKLKAPAPLRGVGAVGGGGVPTAGLDKAASDYRAAVENYVAAQLRLNELDVVKSAQEFSLGILSLANKTDAALTAIQTREADAEIERLRYIELINAGLTDTVAQKIIELETTKQVALAVYDTAIAQLENKIQAGEVTAQVDAQNRAYLEQIKILKDRKDAIEGKFGAFDTRTGKGTGAIGGAVQSEPGKKIQDFIAQSKAELNDLEAVAVRVSQGIGDAIASSMANGITGLIEGTTTAKEVFAGFLKDVGNILIKEGTRMIGMYVAIGIAKMFAGLFSGAAGASKPALPGSMGQATKTGIDAGAGNISDMLSGLAADGAYFANGVAAFAKGGMFTNSVVSSPTLFKFADGGVQRTGLMGEAGPEAIMPLRRSASGRLGVEASGLREAMNSSAGGSMGTPSLNMTFETTNIGGVEYVSRDQLEAAMAATRRDAARDGAKRGMSMTLDKLQQSPGTRSRVGLR